MHIKHQFSAKEYSSKGHDTSTLHSSRTDNSWMQKSLSPSYFGNK